MEALVAMGDLFAASLAGSLTWPAAPPERALMDRKRRFPKLDAVFRAGDH
jgi:hypothetical protein